MENQEELQARLKSTEKSQGLATGSFPPKQQRRFQAPAGGSLTSGHAEQKKKLPAACWVPEAAATTAKKGKPEV